MWLFVLEEAYPMMQHGPLLDEVLSMPGAESSMMVTQQESWLVTYQNSWYEERHQLREYLHGIGSAHQGSQVRGRCCSQKRSTAVPATNADPVCHSSTG